MSSSPTKTTFFRRLVFAAAPLVVLLLVWPAKHAYADIFSAFTDCFTTVTSLGGSTSNIDGTSNQQSQFLTNTIYPQSLINQLHASISTTSSTYRPWMTSVMALPTNSATMASSSQLESATRGGASVPPSQLQSSFQSTYGCARLGQGSRSVHPNRDRYVRFAGAGCLLSHLGLRFHGKHPHLPVPLGRGLRRCGCARERRSRGASGEGIGAVLGRDPPQAPGGQSPIGIGRAGEHHGSDQAADGSSGTS